MKETIKTPQESTPSLSRRDFLKDAGLVIGGATVGTTAILSACGGKTETKTITNTVTNTVTNEVTKTVTKTDTIVDPTDADPRLTFNVNGKEYKVEVKPYWTLDFIIREKLGLTATKLGCNSGECGHCTVLVDGTPIYSCMMLASDAAGKVIETAESLCEDLMHFDRISQAFVDNQAYQCGFCTAGFMMATKALLTKNPHPSMEEIQHELSGHVCVCSAIKRVCDTVYELGGGYA